VEPGAHARLARRHDGDDIRASPERLKLAGEAGPGWEYYLDVLVASRAGEKLPSFEDYYPSQKAYYAEQA
jgi:hypothetical protein